MANATKATKTITASPGSCASFILEPGVQFTRKTNLPANWNKIRIGIMASLTNLVDANGLPNSEPRATGISTLLQSLFIGMSNGVGLPGTVGNKFIGVRSAYTSEASFGCCVSLEAGNWMIEDRVTGGGGAYQTLRAFHGNGTTISTLQSCTQYMQCGVPSGLTAFHFGLIIEIELTTAGNFTWRYVSSATNSNLSDPSDTALLNKLTSSAFTSVTTITGGWWSAVLPNDCQFLDMRFPFLQNRVRIHNTMILDISQY